MVPLGLYLVKHRLFSLRQAEHATLSSQSASLSVLREQNTQLQQQLAATERERETLQEQQEQLAAAHEALQWTMPAWGPPRAPVWGAGGPQGPVPPPEDAAAPDPGAAEQGAQ